MSKKAGLFLVAFLFLFAAIASAAPPAKLFIPDKDFVEVYVADPDENVQSGASVCKDSSGNVVVAWLEGGNVYVQKIDIDGNRLWEPKDTGVKALEKEEGGDNYSAVRVACCGDDVLIAAIMGSDIYLQKVDADGNLIWVAPWIKKIEGANVSDDIFDIACDDANGLFIAWSNSTDKKVYINRIDIGTGELNDNKVVFDFEAKSIGLVPTGTGYTWTGVWVAAAHDITDTNTKTSWDLRAVDTSNNVSPETYAILGEAGKEGSTNFFTAFSDGAGGAICVGTYDSTLRIDGITHDAEDYTETEFGVTSLYDACYVGGSDNLAVLYEGPDNQYNLQKYEIDHENKKFTAVWENPFDVNAAEVTHGELPPISLNSDADAGTARIADLGGGYVGYSWIDGGAGKNHDLFAMVVDPDGNAVFNDVDTPIVIEAGANDAITENVAMLAGSAFCIVNFDPAPVGDIDNEDTYRVGHFDWQLRPDLRWTEGIAYTGELDTDEDTSTITINNGVIENHGQADVTDDIFVDLYLVRDADGVFETWDEWNNATKVLIYHLNIGPLDVGETYSFADNNLEISIDKETLYSALQQLGEGYNPDDDEYYIVGIVNPGNTIDEDEYYMPTGNAKNISSVEIEDDDIYAPDLIPNEIDNDVPDVLAGEAVTLDGVRIGNQGDRDGTTSVSFYLWPSDRNLQNIDDLKKDGIFLKKVEDVTVEYKETKTLDPVELTIPATTGTGNYVIYVVPDADGEVGEFSGYDNDPEDNNLNTTQGVGRTNAFDVTGYPDLIVYTAILSTNTADPGEPVDCSYMIKNQGAEDADPSIAAIYFSDDENLDEGDRQLYQRFTDAVDADDYTRVYEDTVIIPDDVASGTYYILVVTDDTDLVTESDETNNVFAIPITVTGPTPPELEITANTTGGNLVVDVSILDAGDYAGQTGTFAIWGTNPTLGCYTFYGVNDWRPCIDTEPNKFPFIINVAGPYTVLTVPAAFLPTGEYTFHFAVDVDGDGTWDVEDTCTWTK